MAGHYDHQHHLCLALCPCLSFRNRLSFSFASHLDALFRFIESAVLRDADDPTLTTSCFDVSMLSTQSHLLSGRRWLIALLHLFLHSVRFLLNLPHRLLSPLSVPHDIATFRPSFNYLFDLQASSNESHYFLGASLPNQQIDAILFFEPLIFLTIFIRTSSIVRPSFIELQITEDESTVVLSLFDR